ncbi:DUF6404 family protein [Ruegeria arenilitoris]|uniref:DUF6404 family protein n=1 Tax=Ruegeria arenilitoris TaxID=1173585 RepID=UPI001479AB3C|nr:DUF6404 family protein [Ruegeria arenilitoris]
MDEYETKLNRAAAELHRTGLWKADRLPIELRLFKFLGTKPKPLPYGTFLAGTLRLALLSFVAFGFLILGLKALNPDANFGNLIVIATLGSLTWGSFLTGAVIHQGKKVGLSNWEDL